MAILIKRYANRKLYNTEASRYITLKGVSELVRQGRDIRVIDNESGEDITPVVLSQILVDDQKQPRDSNSDAVQGRVISELIQRGGDALYGALRRGVGDASDGIGDLQRSVRRMIKARDEEVSRLGDWIALSKPDFDQMLKKAIEQVFQILDLPRRSDIEVLNANLKRVADAVEALDLPSGAEPVSVLIVNADAHVREQLGTIGLHDIMCIRDEPYPLPDVRCSRLPDKTPDSRERLALIRDAHQRLVGINADNERRFGRFLQQLSTELANLEDERA